MFVFFKNIKTYTTIKALNFLVKKLIKEEEV